MRAHAAIRFIAQQDVQDLSDLVLDVVNPRHVSVPHTRAHPLPRRRPRPRATRRRRALCTRCCTAAPACRVCRRRRSDVVLLRRVGAHCLGQLLLLRLLVLAAAHAAQHPFASTHHHTQRQQPQDG